MMAGSPEPDGGGGLPPGCGTKIPGVAMSIVSEESPILLKMVSVFTFSNNCWTRSTPSGEVGFEEWLHPTVRNRASKDTAICIIANGHGSFPLLGFDNYSISSNSRRS